MVRIRSHSPLPLFTRWVWHGREWCLVSQTQTATRDFTHTARPVTDLIREGWNFDV